MPIPDHDGSLAPPGRHGVAVDHDGLAEPHDELFQRFANFPVIRAVNLFDPPVELGSIDRPSPQGPVSVRPRRDQAKSEPRARPDRGRADAFDCGRVDLGFVTIAVDYGARNILDYRSEAGGDRPPAEPIDQRIFERFEGAPSLRGIGQHGRVILPSGMRNGK